MVWQRSGLTRNLIEHSTSFKASGIAVSQAHELVPNETKPEMVVA